MRCPSCFSRNIREGVGVLCPSDEDMEVRSIDGVLVQCRACGRDGWEPDFQSDCPEGCLDVGWSERSE